MDPRPSRSPSVTSSLRAAVFVAVAAACLTPWVTPPLALAAGIAVALLGGSAFPEGSRKASNLLIQVSVVLLGFSMDLVEVVGAGLLGIAFAAGSIAATFGLGHLLGRLLGTEGKITALVSAGTAICGGSAIAATASAIRARPTQISVAMATVFVLNAIALFVFPHLGRALGLNPHQFGMWAAVAIHDVSSVVGAGTAFDAAWNADHGLEQDLALRTATAIKLGRTLWIVPVSLLAAWIVRRGEPTAGGERVLPVPWFIGLFVLAAAAVTWLPPAAELAEASQRAAKAGMALALFLIGSGLSREAIAAVGWRPMVLGVALWVFISAAALGVVELAAI